MIHEIAILQAARLKGRLTPEATATSVGTDVDAAASALHALGTTGFVKGDKAVRLTHEGRERLAELVAAERAAVDQDALAKLYEEFDVHNTNLKQIISDWQLLDGNPNDHTDATYDRTVIDRMHALENEFASLRNRVADLAPRLTQYSVRFQNALAQIDAGDTTYVARPITDSYHTVWFEFHEELIGLLGLSREDEAAAGRAV